MNDMEAFLNGLTTALDAEEIDVTGAAQRTAHYVREHLGCDLVSVWILEGEPQARSARRIACADVDDPNAHLVPKALSSEQCADYLELIAVGGLFVSADAMNDPLLEAMRDDYLVPESIRATVCVTIAVNGEPMSVISCSERRAVRKWTAAEIAQLKRLAAQISLRRARRHARTRSQDAVAEAAELGSSTAG